MSTRKAPVFKTVRTAYSDLLRVIQAMPVLVGSMIAILIATNLVSLFFLPRSVAGSGLLSFNDFILLAAGVVQSFLVTPFLIAVHRFILLDQVAEGYTLAPQEPRFLRFFGWSLLITALSLLPAALQSWFAALGISDLITGILSFAILIGCFFLTFRLTILFPAIAIDAPGATAANAYADSKGNVWRISFIFLLAVLPFLAIVIVLFSLGMISTLRNTSPLAVAGQIISAIVGVPAYALFVAVASRLFQALGERVNRLG